MKIAITSRGQTLDDAIDPRFGRCAYFLIVDTETLQVEPIANPNVALGSGAGIQSAQILAEHDVKALLTGNCGPNAHQALTAAEVEVIVGMSGVARDAVERYKMGTLAAAAAPNVGAHFGTATPAADAADGSTTPPAADAEPPNGANSVRGMNSARGMGGGLGMGRGRGRGMGGGLGGLGGLGGGGRGQGGKGGGKGGGRGMGGGRG